MVDCIKQNYITVEQIESFSIVKVYVRQILKGLPNSFTKDHSDLKIEPDPDTFQQQTVLIYKPINNRDDSPLTVTLSSWK